MATKAPCNVLCLQRSGAPFYSPSAWGGSGAEDCGCTHFLSCRAPQQALVKRRPRYGFISASAHAPYPKGKTTLGLGYVLLSGVFLVQLQKT